MFVNEESIISIKKTLWALMDLFPESTDRTVHNQLWMIVQKLNEVTHLEAQNGS